MSEVAIVNFGPAPESPLQRSTYLKRVVRGTIGRIGARVGLAFIGVTAFCAVFAPLLANSHPWLIRTQAGLRSPLLVHLTWPDVVLLVLPLVSLVLWRLKRIEARWRWIAFLVAGILATVLSFSFVKPPETVVYERYRQMAAAGQVEWTIHAPIPYSPTDRFRDRPQLNHPLPPWPQSPHALGTERNGADIASRMIHASRIAMSVGFISTGIALVIGIVIGGLMGYFSGIVDIIGMRLVEIFSAIPTLYLLLAFVAFFPRNLYLMMVIIGLTSWVGYAIFVRAEFLRLRQQDFVQAAIACGLPLRSILFKHMLPNGVGPVLVSASFGIASAILAEATLSFLGLGLVDEPSWGQLLSQAVGAGGGFYWWIALFPGMAIFLTVFAYNLIGESLRDAIDPHVSRLPG